MPIPDIIPICRMEDLQTGFVGRCADGKQFFLNEAFVHRGPRTKDWQDSRHEYLVLYLFDSDGHFIKHTYWHGGTTAKCDQNQLKAKRDELLAELGDISFCDIAIRPFSVKIDNIPFGLIPNIVTIQPLEIDLG